jgi:hypothetical protein
MIARGLAKAISNSAVLLKTMEIKAESSCHRGFEGSRFSPFFAERAFLRGDVG